MTSLLKQLQESGQAPWLDFVDRSFLKEGGLKKLVEEDGVTGVTSNPSIFEKAMGHGEAYDEQFQSFVQANAGASITDTYEALAVKDIQDAADTLRPVYDRLDAKDGYVSLEVSPYLANGTEPTIVEARRLHAMVDRPNLMIKVPGTKAGVPAIRQLIEDGLSINVTLLFSLDAYKAVAEAYVAGLEARVAKGEPIDRIASVASFFVSRIDAQIDKKIDTRLKNGDGEAEALKAVRGKVAIANAKLAYQWFLEFVASDRWQALLAKGAQPQRLLWASTGTKDPAYPDTLYVDNLIGPDTVDTLPPKTMDAFRDHGTLAQTLADGVDEAKHVLAEADRLGLDLAGVTEALVEDGVKLFADAADSLLGAIAAKRAKAAGAKLNTMIAQLPDGLQKAVDARLETARADAWTRRLWHGDATLWTGKDEAKWLGWLAAGQGKQVDFAALKALGEEAKGYKASVLLGMGGSSLGPEVIAEIIGPKDGSPYVHALDSTDPGQIATTLAAVDPADTLFLVSSKSGSTMEPELLRAFFFDKAGKQGSHFVAVTDPGSKLEALAKADGFAHIFPGDPAIGGRYSVLSVFGMVPAAIMGIDVEAFFATAAPMAQACGPDAPPGENPGAILGAILGEAAVAGRDKVTLLTSPTLKPFGSWLEQLLAESTGKLGKGIVPVDLEPLSPVEDYGTDRIFALLTLDGDDASEVNAFADALVAAGQPVVRIGLAGKDLIGQEFFRWEIATAIAGAVIGIDPFDQPDVEDAKVKTRELVDAYEQSGSLAPETPFHEDADLAFFAPGDHSFAATDPAAILQAHFASANPGDYVGILAYIERNEEHAAAVARIREAVVKAHDVATVAGFGPRFLHSTGQAYKGGPKSGVFLEITRHADPDLAIPGKKASFGTVQVAQARGDLDVLAERGQRVLRVHLKHDNLALLEELVTTALNS
ncbi:bifunctional transaldolase/phosoglucose isomerase [Sphingomonas nostoxanthinifaciens]|uniref:bifunctional transaldolase/phosoglucose isomerase n=1 Tax=Sphingomonas nostoxanthinifaciens TaxID=2872652 RepID=UPI001CC1F71E|nr:bifunctional transaldolase/phosoglucose isomerase [Sphingomonas nostoxanthinifaciens]UAK23512.1 bifunctional transaldolase/phosoglucose isomerase [Sphingomonas nostoxanthinifaciens]